MLAKGTQEYDITKDSVVTTGISWTKAELNSALPNEVSNILYDKKRQIEINEMLDRFRKDHEPGLNVSKLAIHFSPSSQQF